jgi:hypothetical protein
MADSKITALTALTAADPANDMIPIVDVSDTPPASGNTKRISINNLLACSPSATLASATITGDLTVRTNKLAVTNTGVGIGTVSPGFALDIVGSSGLGVRIYESSTGNNNRLQITQEGTETRFNSAFTTGSAFYTWQIAGSEQMRLNTTGLGVGVTPSAWSAGRGLEVGAIGNGLWCNNSTFNQLLQNAYFNAGFKYAAAASTSAARLELGGGFNFFIAPAGTAGNVITFTQAMTLDASGNLLVGTTGANGSASNSVKNVGGVFSTVNGATGSIATGVAATLFTAPSEAVFIVSAYIVGSASPANYNAVAIVRVSGGTAAITTISTASNLTISLSGLNVQATQTSGINQAFAYSAIRIS